MFGEELFTITINVILVMYTHTPILVHTKHVGYTVNVGYTAATLRLHCGYTVATLWV